MSTLITCLCLPSQIQYLLQRLVNFKSYEIACHIIYTAKAHTAVTTLKTGDVIIGKQLEIFSAKLLIFKY